MAKTVFITGASSGFGKEVSKLFQGKGWNVIATMRSPEKEQDLLSLAHTVVLPLDVTNRQSIHEAVKAGVEKFGTIDVLINSAGYGVMGVFESATDAQMKQQYDVNVLGLMHVTQAVIPFMRTQKSGVIINLSSVGGVTAGAFASLYNSSKFAVEGFSEALSHELAPFNIAVKIVEPGSVATNFRGGIDMIPNKIDDYNSELAQMYVRWTRRTEHLAKATAEEVGQTIYRAATDGGSTLRYVVGDDAQFYIDLKLKNTEADFLHVMRS